MAIYSYLYCLAKYSYLIALMTASSEVLVQIKYTSFILAFLYYRIEWVVWLLMPQKLRNPNVGFGYHT